MQARRRGVERADDEDLTRALMGDASTESPEGLSCGWRLYFALSGVSGGIHAPGDYVMYRKNNRKVRGTGCKTAPGGRKLPVGRNPMPVCIKE